jgi:hypothetical protein
MPYANCRLAVNGFIVNPNMALILTLALWERGTT